MGDLISDALSKVMNAEKSRQNQVVIKRTSKLLIKVLEIIQQNGYLKSFQEEGGELIIELNHKINKISSIKPRFPCPLNEIEVYEQRFLPASNFGLIILTTPEGLLTHQEAKEKNIGGALIAYCY